MRDFDTLLRQLRFAATDAMFSRGEGRRAYPDAVPESIATVRAERREDCLRRFTRWAASDDSLHTRRKSALKACAPGRLPVLVRFTVA